jgi:hypothetical protein
MGAQRSPTKAEEIFNIAFLKVREIDKLLWYGESTAANMDKTNRMLTKNFVRDTVTELADEIKRGLDNVVELLTEEAKT